MKFLITILLISFFTYNLFGQSSFKNFKDEKTGMRTAYADGLIKKEKKYSDSTVVAEIYPIYKNKNYYLIMSNYEMPEGKYFGEWSSPFKYTDDGSTVHLTTSLNDGEYVIHATAIVRTHDGSGGSCCRSGYKDLEFRIEPKSAIRLALSSKIDIKVTASTVNVYKDFDYSFNFKDAQGFRDFAEGMKLISKD